MNADILKASYVDGFNDINKQKEIFENWDTYTNDIILTDNWIGPSKTAAWVMLNYNADVEIADLACGPGAVGEILQKSRYLNVDGYDISMMFLNQAELYYRSVNYCDILATALPRKYPVIIASGVFTRGHLDSAPAQNLADSLTDDGVLVMTVPNQEGYDYVNISGWDAQTALELVDEIGPFKSLNHEGVQHYHSLRIYRKA